MKNLFSIDVEDWFHILDVPSTPDYGEWDSMPSRIEANFIRMLDLLEPYRITATCFFLAWAAKRFPNLVKEAVRRGHDIASHGKMHRLIYQQSRREFFDEISDARKTIEDISGQPVRGFRAPGFSVTEETPFVFDALCEAGYEYDSSVFPASRGHGGINAGERFPHTVATPFGSLWEFPISTAEFLGKRICYSGGGYFRFFPYTFIAGQIRKTNRLGVPVVIYIHPRDIDPEQPRLAMNWKRRFKTYYGLGGTTAKLERLLSDFQFTDFHGYIEEQNSVK